MDEFTYQFVRTAVEVFGAREPVVELGSLRVEGQEDLPDLRGLFPGREYLGLDIREGPGVDRVADATDLSLEDSSAGTVVAVNLLEHVFEIRKAFSEIERVAAGDGEALILIPFHFYIHDHPSDYWRVTPEGLARATSGFPWRIVGRRGWETEPSTVFCVGSKSEPEDFEARAGQFLELLRRRTPHRHGPFTRFKLRLARALHLLPHRVLRAPIHSAALEGRVIRPE